VPPTRRALLTVTPNPSLDLLFEHDRLVWDDANRMDDPRRRPGGQGLNVARAARELGGDALALSLLGGRTGRDIADMLDREGTRYRAVFSRNETRTFVAVRERATGRSLLLNARGPACDPHESDALEQLLVEALSKEAPVWVAGCGSLPRGFPPDFYVRLAAHAHAVGARFVADCDGQPLQLAFLGGCDLLVPNQHEAGRLLGREVGDVASAADAARTLRTAGATIVAVTLGPDGAVLACDDGCWHARPPPLHAGSAVGAGDAFLAALLLEVQSDAAPADALARAVAAGTATLLARGSALLVTSDVDRILPQVAVTELS
jgi:1-phosphofructokinase family hexose kinase